MFKLRSDMKVSELMYARCHRAGIDRVQKQGVGNFVICSADHKLGSVATKLGSDLSYLSSYFAACGNSNKAYRDQGVCEGG